MVLKLYGSPITTCTKRAAVILHEKNVPYEFIPIDVLKGEQRSPEYLEKQPFGKVPYLEDDGFGLFESRAIARYIEDKYPNQGPKLVPTDIQKRALFEQAASIETSNFDAYAVPLLHEAFFNLKYLGVEPDQAKVKELLTTLEAKLDVYEKILAKQKYLAGNEITLADLFHLPYLSHFAEAKIEVLTTRPNVARWSNDIQSRPTWQVVKDGLKPGTWTPSV